MNIDNLTLQNKDGDQIDLDLTRAIVYFYPKADTPGCTTEAKAFTDHLDEFTKHGFTIYGISPDSVDDICNFSDKYDLQHVLLADPDKEAAKAFNSIKQGRIQRRTFIICDGIVIQKWDHKPGQTEEQVLEAVKDLQ